MTFFSLLWMLELLILGAAMASVRGEKLAAGEKVLPLWQACGVAILLSVAIPVLLALGGALLAVLWVVDAIRGEL